MKRHKLNDKDLASLSSITEKITLKDKLKISSFTSNIYNENGDEWLSIELEINASPKIIASLNITLAEELVKSNVADLLLDKTSYRFIPGQKKMANNA